MRTETGGIPDARRDEQGGPEIAATFMDTDLPDYEEDTDERVLDEDSGDETEETPRRVEYAALSQDIPNESPAKSTVGTAEKNWALGYNSDTAESSNRKGTNYIPPPPPLATDGCALSSKSDSVARTGTGSFFPPQYQTIKAKKTRSMEATNLNGIGDFDRAGPAGRPHSMGFDVPGDDRQFAVKNFHRTDVCSNVSVSVSLCHRGGRMENINAWYLNTHMVYL